MTTWILYTTAAQHLSGKTRRMVSFGVLVSLEILWPALSVSPRDVGTWTLYNDLHGVFNLGNQPFK